MSKIAFESGNGNGNKNEGKENQSQRKRGKNKKKKLWKCLLCNTEPLVKIALQKNWKTYRQRRRRRTARNRSENNLVSEDLSLGREALPIPCVNDFDETILQPFTYVCQPIPGTNISELKKNPSFLSCCSCVDNCRDSSRCECAQLMGGGKAYDRDGILIRDQPAGIYECNDLCSCNRNRCQNRVVGRGTQVKLQVFKCAEAGKGWGVKTLTDIPAGTYVTSYLGEILHEADCETRGMKHGDEYLFELDAWGRSRGCRRLEDLGLKWEQQERHQVLAALPVPVPSSSSSSQPFQPQSHSQSSDSPKDSSSLFEPLFPGLSDTATMTHIELSSLLGKSLFEKICRSSAVVRCGDRVILCGGKKPPSEEVTPVAQSSARKKMTLVNGSGEKRKATVAAVEEEFGAWLPSQRAFKKRWLETWQEARSTIIDRVQLETETKDNTFTIDAKWYGNVGRFLNHSCDPNLEKVNVFVDTHDVRLPRSDLLSLFFLSSDRCLSRSLTRVSFFTNCNVKAGMELCYDYGYVAGNVEGKHRECLCGSEDCRKVMY
jgi:hypothetical protein